MVNIADLLANRVNTTREFDNRDTFALFPANREGASDPICSGPFRDSNGDAVAVIWLWEDGTLAVADESGNHLAVGRMEEFKRADVNIHFQATIGFLQNTGSIVAGVQKRYVGWRNTANTKRGQTEVLNFKLDNYVAGTAPQRPTF